IVACRVTGCTFATYVTHLRGSLRVPASFKRMKTSPRVVVASAASTLGAFLHARVSVEPFEKACRKLRVLRPRTCRGFDHTPWRKIAVISVNAVAKKLAIV